MKNLASVNLNMFSIYEVLLMKFQFIGEFNHSDNGMEFDNQYICGVGESCGLQSK